MVGVVFGLRSELSLQIADKTDILMWSMLAGMLVYSGGFILGEIFGWMPDFYQQSDEFPLVFLLAPAAGVLVFVGCMIAGYTFDWRPYLILNDVPQSTFLIVSLAGWLASWILFCILLYRFWKIVPEQNRKYRLGYLIGFLFIPLFNFYWIFVAVNGLAKEFNRLYKGDKKKDLIENVSWKYLEDLSLLLCCFFIIFCLWVIYCVGIVMFSEFPMSTAISYMAIFYGISLVMWPHLMKKAALILERQKNE